MYGGSYIICFELLNLLDDFGIKMQGLVSILSFICNKFNKFNNKGALMLYSIII